MSSKLSGRILHEKNYESTMEPFRVFPKSPDDEIVISGMSGRFPKCDNVQEFRDNLFNKVEYFGDTFMHSLLYQNEIFNLTFDLTIQFIDRYDNR